MQERINASLQVYDEKKKFVKISMNLRSENKFQEIA